MLFHNLVQKQREEVLQRRHIVEVFGDVIKLIGKQGLPFRASTESVHQLLMSI